MTAPSLQLVLGTLPFGGVVPATEARVLLHTAMSEGIDTFDVSHLYGNGEARRLLREAREEFPATRVWCSVGLEQRADSRGVFAVRLLPLSASNLRRWIEENLDALGRDHLDMLNLHAFDAGTPLAETLGALREAKDAGVVRECSYSNLSEDEARAVVAADAERVIGTAQLHGSVLERRLIDTSGRVFADDARSVACFRPLARGLLTRGYSNATPRPADSRSTRGWRLDGYLTPDILGGLEVLQQRIAAAGMSPVEFALSWLAASGTVTSAVVGVRTLSQLTEVIAWHRRDEPADARATLDTFIPEALAGMSARLPIEHFES